MNDHELKTQVATIVTADQLLSDKLIAPPSAMLIPFMKNRETFYLLVSLTFADSEQIAVEARQLCLAALKILIQSGIANGLSGIEVVPYAQSKDQRRRLFRLSVLKDSMGLALRLREQDLLADRPGEGITCGWYVEKPPA